MREKRTAEYNAPQKLDRYRSVCQIKSCPLNRAVSDKLYEQKGQLTNASRDLFKQLGSRELTARKAGQNYPLHRSMFDEKF